MADATVFMSRKNYYTLINLEVSMIADGCIEKESVPSELFVNTDLFLSCNINSCILFVDNYILLLFLVPCLTVLSPPAPVGSFAIY